MSSRLQITIWSMKKGKKKMFVHMWMTRELFQMLDHKIHVPSDTEGDAYLNG